ncbi:MAG: SNF2-related protein [Nitrospira sp.]
MAKTYRFKTRPYRHQYEAIKKLLKNGYGGELFLEPRTGKSKTCVDYGAILATAGKIDKILIVCPARIMAVWVEQFAEHCPVTYHITVWDAKSRRTRVAGKTIATPPPAANGYHQLNVVITNYETFSTPGKRTRSGKRSRASGRFKNREMLRKWMKSTDRGTLMVLDESHRIAKPSGAAATMIVSMHSDADYRVIATGTPVTKAKKVHDLQMQFKFTDPSRFADLATHDEFRNAFGRWIHDNGYPQWIGPKNQAVLQKRLHQSAVVVRREECFDLPPRQTMIRRVPLVSSASAYDQMAAEMVAKIIKAREEHTVEATIKLVQGLRLRQITGGVAKTDEDRLIRIGREKLDALAEILEATAEHEEKLVVAAQFRPDLSSIERLARREYGLRTFRLSGGVPLAQSARDIREFREHDGAAVFVVQPQSGSEGIDLSTAAHLVWYSLTPSYVKYTQMCDRIALSRTSTTFTYLLAERTVDEVLYNTLQTDGDVARAILDKPETLLRDQAQMDEVERLLAREWDL